MFLFSISAQPKDNFSKNSNLSNVIDEITWKSVSYNSARCMAVNSKGYIIAGTWGALISKDNGNTWIRKELPNTNYEINTIAIDKKDNIYATTFDHKFYRSIDDGINWVQLFSDSTHFIFTCVAINSLDEIYVGTEYSGLFRLTNNRDSLKTTGWNSSVEKLSIRNDNVIFILSNQIYRSTDNAKNWANKSSGITNTGINAFAFNYLGHVYVGGAGDNGGVFSTIDSGEHWAVSKYSFKTEMDSVVTSLVSNSMNEVFIGSFGKGISKLNSDGTTLTAMNNGLPLSLPIIFSLCFTPDGHLLTGTMGGIYKSDQVVTSIHHDIAKENEICTVEQNYPNPFNAKTFIQYSLSLESQTKIDIINQNGQLVETLLNHNQQPGKYQITWDATQKVGGIYFYRIKAANNIITKKMLLIDK
jgi:hypothetical protein